MRYSNELKVGATIIVATIIFIFGVRYFEDLPLFRGSYDLVSDFDNAGGLIAGNAVRINGVGVGSISAVYIHPESGRVRVEFHVDSEIPVTEGSYTQISGFDALGVVRMDVHLGPSTASRIPEDGQVPSKPASDLLGSLTEKAPGLVDRVDSVLAGLETVLGETGALLSRPGSEIRRTLTSIQGSFETLDEFLRSERDRLGNILANVDSMTANLNRISGENASSVTDLVDGLKAVMDRLDGDLESIARTSDQLSEVLRKINEGEGTLGLLVNDPSMYYKMDSTLSSLNSLMKDFQDHPGKYLKELRLVDIF